MVGGATRCFLLGFVFFYVASAAAGELSMRLPQQQIEWGNPLKARLVASQIEDDLAQIDLSPLEEDFAVITLELTGGEGAVKFQTLSLELHPRRSGDVILPELILGNARTQAQTLRVDPPMIQDTPLLVTPNVSARDVWQRQQILATVEVKSPDRFFTLESEAFPAGAFEARPFVLEREPIDDDPMYRSRILLGWAVFPLLAGEQSLELPPIQYRQGGKTKRRFFLPRFLISVRELPAYIPPNMPVARLEVSSAVQSNGWVRTGHLAYWTIMLRGQGTLAYWMPPVLRNIQPMPQLEFLEAESLSSVTLDFAGAHTQTVHQIPFKPRRIGAVNLPPLKIEYFDPHTGRIQTLYHQAPGFFAWNLPGLVGVALLLGFAFTLTGRAAAHRYKRLGRRRSALCTMREATSARELRLGLRHLATAEGLPANLSLNEFLSQWRQRYGASEGLAAACEQLARLLYTGRGDVPYETLRRDLLSHLYAPRRRRGRVALTAGASWDAYNILRPEHRAR